MGYIIKLSSYCKPEVQSRRHNNRCKFYTKKSFKTSILKTKWYSVSNFSSRHTFRPERYSWGIHQNDRTPRGNLFKPLAINVKSAHYSIRPVTAGDVDFYGQMADVSDRLTASMQQYIAGTKGSAGEVNIGVSGGKYIFFNECLDLFIHTHSVLGNKNRDFKKCLQNKRLKNSGTCISV